MLAIRLQRTGRSGHAQYRMIVQDARKSPTSGKIVTSLGSYNPHTKSVVIDKEKAGLFLKNGAQPSSRVVSLLAKEGVAIPEWAQKLAKKERAIKNTDKLRKNRSDVAEAMTDRPAGEPAAEAPVEATADEAVVVDVPTEESVAPEPVVESAEVVETVAEEAAVPEAEVAEPEAETEAATPEEASGEPAAQSSTESADYGAVEASDKPKA